MLKQRSLLFKNFNLPSELNKQSNNLLHLRSRSILKICGFGVKDFVQGITTNDIKLSSDRLMYTLFLNRQSRILMDCFIFNYPKDSNETLFIDCNQYNKEFLIDYLTKFDLRKRFKINTLNDAAVFSDILCKTFNKNLGKSIIFKDPRAEFLGTRIYSLKNNTDNKLNFTTEENYYKHLMVLNGIPDDSLKLEKNKFFPLELNYHWLNSISFNKGCYIGQELVSRTNTQGAIRKRLIPALVLPSSKADENLKSEYFIDFSYKFNTEKNEKIITENTKELAGKIIYTPNLGNISLCLLKTKFFTNPEIKFVSENQSLSFIPFIPNFWPAKLQ